MKENKPKYFVLAGYIDDIGLCSLTLTGNYYIYDSDNYIGNKTLEPICVCSSQENAEKICLLLNQDIK